MFVFQILLFLICGYLQRKSWGRWQCLNMVFFLAVC
ncbi:hypothetical protein GLYMA_01G071301v4 [Glycine max]|nr:hypothetical protein GLYMA_10G114250v4 [Glycine max]KAG4403270.1 hypothetical protein GLYMA_01G071301v4 [Glycine max]KAH1162010.1 hypothetical protein GYH30_000755 [Glycine max]